MIIREYRRHSFFMWWSKECSLLFGIATVLFLLLLILCYLLFSFFVFSFPFIVTYYICLYHLCPLLSCRFFSKICKILHILRSVFHILLYTYAIFHLLPEFYTFPVFSWMIIRQKNVHYIKNKEAKLSTIPLLCHIFSCILFSKLFYHTKKLSSSLPGLIKLNIIKIKSFFML